MRRSEVTLSHRALGVSPHVISTTLGSIALGLAICLAGTHPVFAQSSLPPGTTSGPPVPVISTGTPPFGGTLLREIQSPLFGTNSVNIISGSVTSAAFLNASGFLDFVYQFTFDTNTNILVDTISLSSFTGVPGLLVGQTSEDVDGASGLPAQSLGGTNQNSFFAATASGAFSSANRPNVNGDGINATLTNGVTANQTTFAFVVRTQATGFSLLGSASVQGGGISAFTISQGAIAPLPSTAVVPEANTLSLLILGGVAPLAGAMLRRRRRCTSRAWKYPTHG